MCSLSLQPKRKTITGEFFDEIRFHPIDGNRNDLLDKISSLRTFRFDALLDQVVLTYIGKYDPGTALVLLALSSSTKSSCLEAVVSAIRYSLYSETDHSYVPHVIHDAVVGYVQTLADGEVYTKFKASYLQYSHRFQPDARFSVLPTLKYVLLTS